MTLRAKFMAVMALILAAATLLLVSNNIRLSGKFRQTASEIHLAELAPLLSSTLAVPVLEGDVEALQEKIAGIVARRNILHISIENAQGEQLLAAGETFDTRRSEHRLSAGGQMVRLTTPIALAGKQVATATVLLSTDSLDAAHKAVVIESLLIGFPRRSSAF